MIESSPAAQLRTEATVQIDSAVYQDSISTYYYMCRRAGPRCLQADSPSVYLTMSPIQLAIAAWSTLRQDIATHFAIMASGTSGAGAFAFLAPIRRV